jgi:ComF family protein
VSALQKTCATVFSLVYPEECRVCGQPLTEVSRVPVCSNCIDELEPLTADFFCRMCRTPFANEFPLDADGLCGLCRRGLNGFDAAYSFGIYEGTLRQLVHLFKYDGVRTLAKPLGTRMAWALPRGQEFDVIVPMPLHWWRGWRRGFNQSALLAGVIGKRSGLPVVNAMKRIRSTPPQAGLSNRMRRRNVAGAFAVRRPNAIAGKHVLLVDDVLTTGATLSACAAALKRGGASRVSALTLARADRQMSWNAPAEQAGALAVGSW